MSKSILFCMVVALTLTIALAGCASPTPTPTSPPPTPLPPTATSAPTKVPPTATVAPTAMVVPPMPTTVSPTATSVPPTITSSKEVTASLTWLGHPTFVLKTSTGLIALLDPTTPAVGYPVTSVSGVDLVTVSHEHSDHNNVALATGSPTILRGLAGNDWAKIDQTIKGVRVRTVGTYHDETQGTQRGKTAIFIFEFEGFKIAHLGDLGHKLSDEQIKTIGAIDVMMIPVGGFYTIDGKVAAEVVAQLNPKIVVPMHYKTPALSASLAGVLADAEGFLAAMSTSAQIERTGKTLSISSTKLPAKRTVYVMNYQ